MRLNNSDDVQVDGPFWVTQRWLAEQFEMSRDTVSRRLSKHKVKPAGTRNRHPVYRLRDAAPALVQGASTSSNDPVQMTPTDRRAWFQGESLRTDLEAKQRKLIPAAEHEASLAKMAQTLVQFCDTLPDVMERDLSLDGEQVEHVQRLVDKMRERLYMDLVAS